MRAERELACESNQRQVLLDTALVLSFVEDAAGCFTRVNPVEAR